jgi:hypothetical protein
MTFKTAGREQLANLAYVQASQQNSCQFDSKLLQVQSKLNSKSSIKCKYQHVRYSTVISLKMKEYTAGLKSN